MAALTFEQLLAGCMRFTGASEEHAVRLRLRLSVPLGLRAPLGLRNRHQGLAIEGTVEALPLPHEARLDGALFLERGGVLRYQLQLRDAELQPLDLTLRSTMSLAGLPPAATLVEGNIARAGHETLGELSLRFDPRAGPAALLRSIRLRR
jgi:hypothetical protein